MTRVCVLFGVLLIAIQAVAADDHWAYQPVERHSVPKVVDTNWPSNPIDNFVLAKLESRGWKPAADVSRRVLLRRVFLNLSAIPPTLDEQQRFLNDRSPDAFEKIVDDLLTRPGYGERWGRHWLDLVRYAETNGYERDAIKPHAWRYRDYVIAALNADKPYDRFVLEQLAGDELPDRSTGTMIATGYHRLGPWDDEPADPKQDRFDQLDDLVRTTSRAFLGITLGCARCHDHKFDALTIRDYYRMVAVFAPLQRPRNGRKELDLPAGSLGQLAAISERDRKIQQIAKNAPGLQQRIDALKLSTPDLPRGYFLREPSPNAPSSHILLRGRASTPGAKVEPGIPAVLGPSRFLKPDTKTTRRRLSLARWIVRPENPLTPRVIVNRVWLYHFGEGLVSSASDFGTIGIPPTHPELLDWLAHWFVHDANWSLKKLNRLILSSRTYHMSKRADARHQRADPENMFLWRFPYRRLEVEAIRDSMLAVSGHLNRKMRGPSTYLSVPKEALTGHSDPGKIWKPLNEREASRRTVYAFIKRSFVVPMLEVLDLCDTTRSSEKRNVTSVPTQALTLLNGEFANRQARHFADRLRREAGDDPGKQIDLAMRLALCRPPTETERVVMKAFLKREAANLRKEKPRPETEAKNLALRRLCRVIFNLNEFVYPD